MKQPLRLSVLLLIFAALHTAAEQKIAIVGADGELVTNAVARVIPHHFSQKELRPPDPIPVSFRDGHVTLADGAVGWRQPLVIESPGHAAAIFLQMPEGQIRLHRGQTITGRVVGVDGQAVPDAVVDVTGLGCYAGISVGYLVTRHIKALSVRTAADGSFLLTAPSLSGQEGIPPCLRLRVDHEIDGQHFSGDGPRISSDPKKPTEIPSIIVHPSISVQGQLVQRRDGKPLADQAIEIFGLRNSVELATDKDGYFHIPRLPPYGHLLVEMSGRLDRVIFRPSPGCATTNVRLEVSGLQRVQFRCVDAKTKQPVAGANMVLFRPLRIGDGLAVGWSARRTGGDSEVELIDGVGKGRCPDGRLQFDIAPREKGLKAYQMRGVQIVQIPPQDDAEVELPLERRHE